MAQKFILFQPPPIRDPIADSGRGFLVTFQWEQWFHRLLAGIFNRQSCHVYFTADQSIANNTETDLLFSAEEHDNASFHSTSSNTDQLVIPEDGIYCVGAHVLWASGAAGTRNLLLTLNDPAPSASVARLADNRVTLAVTENAWNQVTVVRSFLAKDVLRLSVFQVSGGNLAVNGTDTSGPRANGFWCYKVSGV